MKFSRRRFVENGICHRIAERFISSNSLLLCWDSFRKEINFPSLLSYIYWITLHTAWASCFTVDWESLSSFGCGMTELRSILWQYRTLTFKIHHEMQNDVSRPTFISPASLSHQVLYFWTFMNQALWCHSMEEIVGSSAIWNFRSHGIFSNFHDWNEHITR
jgi:hypothetical protein